MGELVAVIGAINSILTMIGNFTKQATEMGALVKKLQEEKRAMTTEEWALVDKALKAARDYAMTAEPPIVVANKE